jgi:hypothetical protein
MGSGSSLCPPPLLYRFQKTKEKDRRDCDHPFKRLCPQFLDQMLLYPQQILLPVLFLQLFLVGTSYNFYSVSYFFISFNQSSHVFLQYIFILLANISIISVQYIFFLKGKLFSSFFSYTLDYFILFCIF